jgi:hypothetical protein
VPIIVSVIPILPTVGENEVIVGKGPSVGGGSVLLVHEDTQPAPTAETSLDHVMNMLPEFAVTTVGIEGNEPTICTNIVPDVDVPS